MGVTPDGRACAMPAPVKHANGNDVKYIEIDLDAFAPLGRYENYAFKSFEVRNTLHRAAKNGTYWQYR